MSKVISQETYNEAVRENISEFSMTPEEAIEDAVKQFEAQGVDLSNIIKDLSMSSSNETQTVAEAVRKIGDQLKTKSPDENVIIHELHVIKRECDIDLQHKVLAGKQGAYPVLIDVLNKYENEPTVRKEAAKSVLALMAGQPDLLDSTGLSVIMKYLLINDDELLRFVLKWIKECCTKHEMNRQIIFDASVLDVLKPMLESDNPVILREVLAVLRSLVLDDDIRVEYGRSHEHARIIASETLCFITALLTKLKNDEQTISDLMLTLSNLLVRSEFCKKVDDAGGIQLILQALVDYHTSEKVNRQCLKLLKALAGNDSCKDHIIKQNGAHVITSALSMHKSSPLIVISGLGCVAALALRNPENSKALFEAGLPEVVIECMKLHPDNVNVQKNASWAVRNMVSRSRYQNEHFLSLGVEALLKQNMKKFGGQCEYDMKAALRDLGCNVDFKEEWTGKGGKITTQEHK